MPKMKTHKGSKKRFKVTANGKIKHRKAGTSHLAWRKSSKTKRQRRGTRVLSTVETRRLHKSLKVLSAKFRKDASPVVHETPAPAAE